MDLMKVLIIAAFSFISILFMILFFSKNPDEKLFDETVASLMIIEGLSSVDEVIDVFPVLENIKSKMDSISYLKNHIDGMSGGPSPIVSKEESQQLKNYKDEILKLRRSIERELNQLLFLRRSFTATRINEK